MNGFCVGFSEKVQQNTAEVVGVAVGVAQLVCNRIQEQVSTWKNKGNYGHPSDYVAIPLQAIFIGKYVLMGTFSSVG